MRTLRIKRTPAGWKVYNLTGNTNPGGVEVFKGTREECQTYVDAEVESQHPVGRELADHEGW